MAGPQVLYITYDGLLEPLGQSQVLPYLRGLASEFGITVLSFEKPKDWADASRRRALQEDIRRDGIAWIPLRYHKRPSVPATAFDVAHGVLRGVRVAAARKPKIVHVRGYVPGVIGLALKSLLGTSLIFDMRGFWPDERVDGGTWRQGSGVYRAAKWFESKLLLKSDVVVSLTRAGVNEMRKFPCLRGRDVKFEVIPTCTDLELFRPSEHRSGRKQHEFVLGYVGSVGTFYLFERVVEFYKVFADSCEKARLLIVNRHSHPYIRSVLSKYGVAPDSVELVSCDYAQVPVQINRMDAGVFFTARHLSHAATAPTRLGEMLGCGVPCVVNPGMGDTDEIIMKHRTGILVKSYDQQSYQRAAQSIHSLCAEPGIEQRCVRCAQEYFSLERGVATYHAIYNESAGRVEFITRRYEESL